MKKTILATAVLAAAMTAQADVTLFGNVEQRLESTNSAWNVNGDDNYFGVKAVEDLGNGASAFAVLSMDLGTETGSTATARDQYVGLSMSGVTVQAGRFKNLEKSQVSDTVDAFHGTSFTSDNADRVDSAVAVMGEVGVVRVAGAVIADNAGEDKMDAYEVAGGIDVGPAAVTAYYSKNKTTDAVTKAIAASGSVGEFNLGATAERSDAGVDTYTVVGSTSIGGNNTLTGGYETIENGVDTYVVEVAHNFSKNVAAYVNYSDNDADNSNSITMVGLNYSF